MRSIIYIYIYNVVVVKMKKKNSVNKLAGGRGSWWLEIGEGDSSSAEIPVGFDETFFILIYNYQLL